MSGRIARLGALQLVVAASLLAARQGGGTQSIDPFALLGLTAAFALVGLVPMHLELRRNTYTVTLVEAVVVVSLFVVGPLGVAIAAAAGEAVANLTHRYRLAQVVYNTVQTLLAATLAGLAFDLLGRPDPLDPTAWLAALAAAATFGLVSWWATATAVAITEGRSLETVLVSAATTVGIATAVSAGLGVAAVVLVGVHPVAPILLAPVIAVAVHGSRRQAELRAERLRLERLHDGLAATLSDQQELHRRESEFVAAVSHELRTPLSVVLASVDTLRRLDRASEVEMVDQLLDAARDNGRRLHRLIEDLLLVAAADGGSITAVTERVEIESLLRDVAGGIAEPARDRVVFRTETPELTVDTDHDKLRVIVEELVDNALKHADGPVELTARARGERLEIVVTDRGPGVSETDRERVFDRFVQLDGSTSRLVGGTGLGLYLARRLGALLGGLVTLDGGSGGGCVARVVLPLHRAGTHAVAAAEVKTP